MAYFYMVTTFKHTIIDEILVHISTRPVGNEQIAQQHISHLELDWNCFVLYTLKH